VATLAISGVPFFSGFASKDAILASALHFVIDQPEHVLLFLFPVLGATVTAFVMFRLWFLIFAGQPRSPAASRAVEGDRWLTWPLIALAIPTIALGWPIPGFGFKPILEQVLEYGEPIDSVDPGSAAWWAFGASILVLSIGSGLSVLSHGPWDRWRRFDSKKTASRFGPIHEFLVQKWYFDELYQTVIVGPILRLARAIGWFDRKAVDGLVNGSAESTRRLSRFEGVFDRVAVDGLVRFVAWGAYATGNQARRLQTGSIRTYLMILAIAFVGICAFMFAWVLA
jgi:NADH:ubiquinone oxidoreductase subunit 5 (subunit L)/multisubunit Na+/H+ antiporter MnhA subunit